MPRDRAGHDKNISIEGMKVLQEYGLFTFGLAERKKRLCNYEPYVVTTNCDFILLLILVQLRSSQPSFNPQPSPIHSYQGFRRRAIFLSRFRENLRATAFGWSRR